MRTPTSTKPPSSDKAKHPDVSFKPADKDPQDTLALDIPLKTVQPGGDSLAILQYGSTNAAKVPLTAYNAGIKLDELKLHTGDNSAILNGSGLKDVASVEIESQTFTPAGDGKLTFVVQTQNVFPRDQTIEVATANEAVHTSLSISANTLVLYLELRDDPDAVATITLPTPIQQPAPAPATPAAAPPQR